MIYLYLKSYKILELWIHAFVYIKVASLWSKVAPATNHFDSSYTALFGSVQVVCSYQKSVKLVGMGYNHSK